MWDLITSKNRDILLWFFSIEFITYDSFFVHTSSHRENKNIKKFIIN